MERKQRSEGSRPGKALPARKPRAWIAQSVVTVACLLAFLFRIYHAGDQGIWGDEIFSVWYSMMSLPDIIKINLANLDAHAPLFYYVLKFWTLLAGQNELVFRFPSAFFGVLAVPLIYRLGKHLAGRGAGLIACVVMAANPFQVWYGQETRTYALTTSLTLLSVLLFLTLLQKKGSFWLWSGYCLVTLLSISSHYYAFLIVAVEDLYLLLLLSRRKLDWRPWAIAQAVLAVPLIAGLWQAGNMILRYQPERLPLHPLAIVSDYLLQYSLGWFVDPDIGRWVLAVFLALATVGLVRLLWARADGIRSSSGIFLVLYLLAPFIGAMLYFWVTAGFPPRERYLIIVTPAFYILVSSGVSLMRRLSPLLMALAIPVVLAPQVYALGSYYGEARYARPDYRAIAHHVQAWEDPGDAVVAVSHLTADIFRYYYKGAAPVTQFRYYPGENTREEIERKLSELAQQYKRIWLLPYGDGHSDPEPEEWLNANAFEVENRWLAQARLALYATGTESGEQPAGVGANLEHRMELASSHISQNEIRAGDVLKLALGWRALQDSDERYKVFIRLRDDRGHVLRQIDRPLGGAMRSGDGFRQGQVIVDRCGLMVPNGVIAGAVSVEVGLYQERDGRSLSFLDASLAPKGTWLTLGVVQVLKGPAMPSLDRLEIPQRLTYDGGGDLRLVGFGLSRESLTPGDNLIVSLFWQALATGKLDPAARLELVDEKGAVVESESVTAQRYPVAGWAQGEVLRDFIDLTIPANVTSGRYRVRLTGQDGTRVALGELSVKARERRFDMPKTQQSLAISWDDVARLRGFDLSGERGRTSKGLPAAKPGDKLRLTLYWEALHSSSESYSVFTHLLDGNGGMWGQHDGIPASAAAPTPGWITGEIVSDEHELIVKEDAPEGEYVIEVGLYDPSTGRRLKTASGEDRLILGKVTVIR